MRIVSGRLRGRRLGPVASGTRPTSDRVREAIFNILANGLEEDPVADGHVLDLFAGSGALGLEAFSRGASSVTFVEKDAVAVRTLRRTISEFGIGEACTVVQQDAAMFRPPADAAPISLILLDPPYRKGLGAGTLQMLAVNTAVNADAIAVLEEAKGAVKQAPAGWVILQSRVYGTTEITFLKRAPHAAKDAQQAT
ncbi:MAG: 16S rRNA (guanine(966)-N(2))-methyltransferase RsmD [Pseudomonadota bacterium]